MHGRRRGNGALVDLFFGNPDFATMFVGYLAGTYDEFRAEASAG